MAKFHVKKKLEYNLLLIKFVFKNLVCRRWQTKCWHIEHDELLKAQSIHIRLNKYECVSEPFDFIFITFHNTHATTVVNSTNHSEHTFSAQLLCRYTAVYIRCSPWRLALTTLCSCSVAIFHQRNESISKHTY